jgi:hypothetical protein
MMNIPNCIGWVECNEAQRTGFNCWAALCLSPTYELKGTHCVLYLV